VKKIILLLSLMFLVATNAFAYRIEAIDEITYEYRDGKSKGKGIPQSWVFEVDKEN